MDCKEARENLLEMAGGKPSPAAEHVGSCAECAAEVEKLRATMALLDEWKAPEPSPYFDQRLHARLREERERVPAGVLGWLRKPALAAAFAVLMAASIVLFRGGESQNGSKVQTMATARTASAVADLQSLDQNEDLYANFDLLDDLPNQDNGQVQQ